MEKIKKWLRYYGMPQENIDKCATQIAQGYGACRYLDGVNDGAEWHESTIELAEQKSVDEIKPKFKHGDRVRNKKSGLEQTLGSCIEDVYEGAFPFPFRDQDDWELVKQTPADNVEPKFHEGDWVIGCAPEDEPMQIAEITEEGYKTTYGGWIGFSFEEDMHLWSIRDAKDGDIIYAKSKSKSNQRGNLHFIRIFSKIEGNNSWAYCSIYSSDLEHWDFIIDKGYLELDGYDFYPATKEQWGILLKEMHEAGYEWDSEKKEVI